jgi:hypothetical protein
MGALTATTGTFSGNIQSTVTSGAFLFNTSATTGSIYHQLGNTSGAAFFGLEGSVPGNLITGDAAYDTCIIGKTRLVLAANNGSAPHLIIASTGAVTLSSTLGVASTTIIGSDPGGAQLLRVGGSVNMGALTATTGAFGGLVVVSNATAPAMTINSTLANGLYVTLLNSSVPFGDLGSAKQIYGGTLADFAITSRSGQLVLCSQGGIPALSIAAASPAVSLASTLAVTGDFSVATSKFTVASASGNTVVGGTLAATGQITATGGVSGALTGNVTGNCSGSAATVTGAAQTAITSVGTLTGLTVGNGTGATSWFNTSTVLLGFAGSTVGFFGNAAVNQRTVTGSRVSTAALTSLLSALAQYNLIVDSSTT